MSRNKQFVSVLGTQSAGFLFGKYVKDILSTVGIDLSFQSRARWNDKKKQHFINSILMGMNISKFILVDVEKCLINSVDQDDKDYYQMWLDRGVKYLNVDSNNRTTSIREFVNDEVKIMQGDYFVKGQSFTVDSNNDTYSTMDENFRILLDAEVVPMHIIEKATRKQLSDLFGRMNSGESLNIFEKLNASNSLTAEIIRNISDKHGQKMVDSPMFTENQWNRRVLDGWVANIFYLYVNGVNKQFNKATHTKWYDIDSISNQSIAKFEKDFNRYIRLVGDKINLFHHKWAFFDLFNYIINAERQGGKLDKSTDIVQDFIDMYTILVNEKSARFSYDENITDESAMFKFKQFMRGEGFNTPTRTRYYESDGGWNTEKYFIQTDSKRTVSKLEKQNIAVRDGWVDSDGDQFAPETLFDGEYDAGHITAHAKGGKTVDENLVIEKASKNRSKQTEETVVVKK